MNNNRSSRGGVLRLLISKLVFRSSYGLMSRCRTLFYRFLGMTIGSHCRFENIRVRRPQQVAVGAANALSEGCWLWPIDDESDQTRIRIGDGNYFNRDVMIDACGYVEVGSDNMFGPGVYIADSNHTMVPGSRVANNPMDVGKVVIGNGCWIGARATILKDVTLGDRCVVAAGAVVTKCFPANSIVAGVPARLVSTLPNE